MENKENETFSIQPFGFQSSTNFNAKKDMVQTRNEYFKLQPPDVDNDIWKRLPPDFRPQAFAPKPPKRNTRESMQPWKYADISKPPQVTEDSETKHFLPPIEISASYPNFCARARLMRPDSARQLFVRKGMHPPEPYSNPEPHDFRGLIPAGQLGLSEFVTSTEKDPFNIKLELANRRTITGALHDIKNIRDCSGTMASAVRQPPKWSSKLHHPLGKWPRIPCEYTRYRVPHGDVHEAFMERIEETLQNRWNDEKRLKLKRNVCKSQEKGIC